MQTQAHTQVALHAQLEAQEFLAAGEQKIVHTKPFFFPFSSATTCTNRPLEVDQRTPKHFGCLNTLHQTLGDGFTSCWGRVEEFLAAGEQEIVHTKPFFFPFSSAATCTNCPLELDQSFYLEYNELRFEYKIS
ncbi:hypothetical protein Taro_006908 [Colocasia esculenta]|uniref:Uncharacterized protein n=1 Tax=Colocasia esculenta TaxID=4460 RepID=A0A843TQ10_COLES|nr:hypothetical protein [Colocasia esculenta]